MDNSKKSSNIFLTIFIILFVLAFFRVLFGSLPLTFSGFLKTIETVPSIDVTSSMISLTIGGSWGILDGLRLFINSIMTIAEVGVFFSANIINLLLILVWILRFFFLPF